MLTWGVLWISTSNGDANWQTSGRFFMITAWENRKFVITLSVKRWARISGSSVQSQYPETSLLSLLVARPSQHAVRHGFGCGPHGLREFFWEKVFLFCFYRKSRSDFNDSRNNFTNARNIFTTSQSFGNCFCSSDRQPRLLHKTKLNYLLPRFAMPLGG